MQNEKLTVLVPFRNREENLKVFIPYFHNYMKNNFPYINYEIVIVEQGNDKTWNKGILFNAGFLITSGNTDYYSLHDVGQLPITAVYKYSTKPYHLSVNIFQQGSDGIIKNTYEEESFQHRGGDIIIDKECYIKANGHSNMYWGWGLVDDDFTNRLIFANVGLHRYKKNKENDSGYYVSTQTNVKRFGEDKNYAHNHEYALRVINGEIDWKTEGLNTTKFDIISKVVNKDYIKYVIDFENNIK